jgi:hypothetical protein
MQPESLFPYLQRRVDSTANPPHRRPLDHDLEVVIYHDTTPPSGDPSSPLLLEQLEIHKLSAEDAYAIALENLAAFAESGLMELKTFGQPGAERHFVLLSDHRLASACLLLPYLREEIADLLGTDELCAMVPQQASLVVFPKRDRAFCERMLSLIREVEADADRPLTMGLFELTAAGPVAFRDEV